MAPHARRHPSWLVLISFAALAGCQSDRATAPFQIPTVRFAQGDNATWTVTSLGDAGDGTCDDAECTLREALAAATSGGRIVFAAGLAGDILLTPGASLLVNKGVSVDGEGRIAIDAQRGFRVFTIVDATGPVTLSRLTVKNGSVGGNGAGIAIGSSEVTLDSLTVTGGQAGTSGGGVHVNGGTVTIRNSTIHDNFGENGGGVAVLEGTVTIVASTISGNGGEEGGGLSVESAGIVTVERSTISGNTATTRGAGVGNDGTVIFRSATITRNTASAGAGGITNEGLASLSNTIMAGNTGGSRDDCGGGTGITTLGHNVVGETCNSAGEGDVPVFPSQVFTEVLDPALASNGGPTRTHALIAGGRAIDAGYCPGLTTDQRGLKRPFDVASVPNVRDACDIGAYELQGPVIAVADLIVSQSVNKTSVKQGDLLTYSVRVQNLGPESAPNVVLTNALSSGVTFVSAGVNKGTLIAPPNGETGTVTWNLGTMANNANEVATITVTVLVRGKTTITNAASVTAEVSDPNPANNSAAITVSVGAGGSGGGSGGSGNGGGPGKKP